MKRLILLFYSFVLLHPIFCSAAHNSGFFLKEGDRVVFYGDSITDQRLYTTFVETYAVTRFPKMKLHFVHSGWGGDRVGGGWGGKIDLRLKRDVFVYNPTVVTVMLGMNDGSYTNFQEKIFSTYSSGYKYLVASLKKNLPNVRLTLIQPSPYDDITRPPVFEGGYNQVLVRYGEFVKELASQNGASVADLNGPVVAALEKANSTDTNVAAQIIADRVHPGAAGQLLMANELLKSWKAPALVSDVEIDAAARTVIRNESCSIKDIGVGDTLSWIQTDEALPMPIGTNDAVIALAVKSSDVVEALDKQLLKVTSLSANAYTLKIDGEAVKKFSRQQLAQGINIALLPTPMFKQASQVHKLTLQHNDLHFNRWRNVQVPLAGLEGARIQEAVKELIDALDEEEATVTSLQRQAAQPTAHRFELVPAS